jgi:hypothetical protein
MSSYVHHSNWEPIVAYAWVAMTEEDFCKHYAKCGGTSPNNHSQEAIVFKNTYFTLQPTADAALVDAKRIQEKDKKQVLIYKLGFSELTCINGLQCAVHGDTMDFPATVVERLSLQSV